MILYFSTWKTISEVEYYPAAETSGMNDSYMIAYSTDLEQLFPIDPLVAMHILRDLSLEYRYIPKINLSWRKLTVVR